MVRTVVWGAVLGAFLAAAAPAAAQGVGNLPALPTTFWNQGGGWFVSDQGGAPIPVIRDPNGPKWIKNFFDPTGTISPTPGALYSVTERLLIAPQLDWTDWHEEILTPGWEWTSKVLMLVNVSQPPSGLTVINLPGTPIQGGTLEFYFDPLSPGTVIDIRKELKYVGPQGMSFDAIQIAQYPTPEPATMGLLALGGLVLGRRRSGVAV